MIIATGSNRRDEMEKKLFLEIEDYSKYIVIVMVVASFN
jgi:hypothetical protein